jgi:hypothetical protein
MIHKIYYHLSSLQLSTLFFNQNKYPEALAILGIIIDIYNHEQKNFILIFLSAGYNLKIISKQLFIYENLLI